MEINMDMNWFQVLVIVFGNAAWTIPMWLWARSEARADSRQMMSIAQSIQEDMKDFHARLAVQDAEFKAHMMYYHTERNKGG